jgi:hypothetical protein
MFGERGVEISTDLIYLCIMSRKGIVKRWGLHRDGVFCDQLTVA